MLDQIEQAVEQRHATEQRLSRLIALAEEGIYLMSGRITGSGLRIPNSRPFLE